MSRPLRYDLLAAILGLATGMGAAAWISAQRNEPDASPTLAAASSTAPAAPIPQSPAAVVATAPRQAKLEAMLAAGPDQRPFWQTLAAVSVPGDKADAWLHLPVLRAKGPPKPPSPLNPEFTEFFGLNEAEQAKIVGELDAVIAEQTELDLKAAQPLTIEPSEGFLATYELALRVAPYPEAGAALHDRLRGSLAATLGPERMAVYENWAPTSLLADWQGLGLSERTIHIKRQNAGTPYERWDFNYSATAPDGARKGSNSAGNTLEEADQRAGFPISRWIKDHPPAGPANAAKAPPAGK